MKTSLRNKAFPLGFGIGLVLFAVANSIPYIMAFRRSLTYRYDGAPIGDGYGFPFTFYYVFGGIPSETLFVWVEALANVLTALIVSFLLGRICGLIFRTPLD